MVRVAARLTICGVALGNTVWVLIHMVIIHLNGSWTISEPNSTILISEIAICSLLVLFSLGMGIYEWVRYFKHGK